MARSPLAKGDDGSGNRYPVRHFEGSDVYFSDEHLRHHLSGVAHADCSACVPAALIVPTPERFDPPCEGDA